MKKNNISCDNYTTTTKSIRVSHERSQFGEHSEALFLTSSYVFDSAKHAADRFSGESSGNVYSRYTNPTVQAFEERFAQIEGADSAAATSSGMSAILSVFMTFLKSGDQILCSKDIFGSTVSLLNNFFVKMNIDVVYLSASNYEDWDNACSSNTKLLFVETPSNPLNKIVDIEKLSTIAKKHGAILAVDNTYATPIIQRPLELGADLSIYSTTKYIDGQGRCLGGIVTGSEDLITEVISFIRSGGPSISPFNAWLLLKSLETLTLRIQRHTDSALKIARWLENQEHILKVHFSGLVSHANHELAKRQQNGMFGAVISFVIKGDLKEAWTFIDSTRLLSLTANLGDAKSTIIHPASTTHSRLSVQEKKEANICDSLIRISVGLESVEDIISDLQLAINAISQ